MSELVRVEQRELSPIEMIQRAASDPSCDVAKMEQLLGLAERMQANTARVEFYAAMARLQAKMPRIIRDGAIAVGGVVRSRYAKLENIDRIIRPLLAEEGFALSFDTDFTESKLIVIARLTHSAGHSEEKRVPLALDSSGSKNATQATGSTISYGQRYLIKMIFNLVEDEEDTDAHPTMEPITRAQATVLRNLVEELNVDTKPLLKWAKADSIESIPKSQYEEAVKILEKRRQK